MGGAVLEWLSSALALVPVVPFMPHSARDPAAYFIWDEPVVDYAWVMGVNVYGILHGIQAFHD